MGSVSWNHFLHYVLGGMMFVLVFTVPWKTWNVMRYRWISAFLLCDYNDTDTEPVKIMWHMQEYDFSLLISYISIDSSPPAFCNWERKCQTIAIAIQNLWTVTAMVWFYHQNYFESMQQWQCDNKLVAIAIIMIINRTCTFKLVYYHYHRVFHWSSFSDLCNNLWLIS